MYQVFKFGFLTLGPSYGRVTNKGDVYDRTGFEC